MSNIIINEDRWGPKPKYVKLKTNASKVFHKKKNALLGKGYTEEEIDVLISKESEELHKKNLFKRKHIINEYIKNKLDILTLEQQDKLLCTVLKDFKGVKIKTIKNHIDKLSLSIKKELKM